SGNVKHAVVRRGSRGELHLKSALQSGIAGRLRALDTRCESGLRQAIPEHLQLTRCRRNDGACARLERSAQLDQCFGDIAGSRAISDAGATERRLAGHEASYEHIVGASLAAVEARVNDAQ